MLVNVCCLRITYIVKSLTAIEVELVVTGDEGHVLGDGVSYDEVVTWIKMSLRLVDDQPCIGMHVFLMNGQYVYAEVILDVGDDVIR